MRGLRNWGFKDVVSFLKSSGFKECEIGHDKGTSHHYFQRSAGKKYYLVHVQYHAKKSIPIGTMKAIVNTSGIPEKEWRA
ncbi:MAG TPA: type II toxin-antitoxin system HicA family toxin [Candidatus Dormibacteraeota bacterium]|nr:type II toxin-antitoxin system HicA family toxin [Candidatus Dormibacteraeota bacterium]